MSLGETGALSLHYLLITRPLTYGSSPGLWEKLAFPWWGGVPGARWSWGLRECLMEFLSHEGAQRTSSSGTNTHNLHTQTHTHTHISPIIYVIYTGCKTATTKDYKKPERPFSFTL